jgi:predicted anti-sigma-YlaC factor YlaD
MVALACNLNLLGPGFFAGLAAVLLTGWYYALAGYMAQQSIKFCAAGED